MKKSLQRFLLLFMAIVMSSSGAWAEFKDFSAILNNQRGTLLYESEQTQGTAVTFGVAVDADAKSVRVAADDASAVATISGTYHNDHGMTGLVVTVPVEGSVKIIVGQCTYSSSAIVVKNSDNQVVVQKTPATACWKNDPSNVTELYYTGEATTLTISGMGYCPYVAVEKSTYVPTSYAISYSLGDETAEGAVPANATWTEGDTYTVPANYTLYKEGYTLTGWTDGTNTLKAGETYTPSADVTLTPVFTQNTKNLSDRTAEVTVKWDFQRQNGAPTVGYQNVTGIWVTQATVEGETIDVKLDFDTNNGGKIANANWTDWCQMNKDTKLTVPSAKGAVVSMEALYAITTTTIDGQKDYTSDKTISATVASTTETIDIVIGDGSYYRYIQTVLPVVEQGGGDDDTNVWEDIKIDLTNAALLTTEEAVQKTALSLGVAVKDGAISRVETTDPSCDIALSGTFHSNEHGWGNFSATVAVEGPVRISMGTCAWGGDVTVKDAEGNTVATFNTNNGACYHNDKTANIASAIYKGEATTLTISGGSYTPYIAVEAVDPSTLVETKTATFSLGDYADCGVAPEAISADQNTEITIPGNYTMYKEGYTLTGWHDGTSTIALGAKYTLTDNVTLTPVFTQNTKTLADRTEAVTLKWNFRKDQGAPVIAVEGASNGIGVWVTQANVAGETIDVKMDYDATSGKINNASNTDWAQVNDGTTFTIPSAKGAAVSMEAYYQFKRDGKTATTIDGQSDYTAAKTVSYTIAGSAETIDIVVGSDAGYLRYIQTVLPVVEQGGEGGKTYTDEAASVVFAMNNLTSPGDYTATPADGFSTVAFDYGDCTLDGTTTITMTDGTDTGITAIKFKPAGQTTALNWFVRPAAGLTFTPTKVKGYINRCGTDAEKGVTVTAHKADGENVALGAYTAWRQGKSSSNKAYDEEAVYYYEIELTADQQAQLAGTEGFYLTATVGVGNTKQGAFGEVTISGKLNGTLVAVNKYTLALEAAPAEGGSVSAYPASEEYIEGDVVQLTATENFGYDFVNWTNAAGEVVSTEAKFKYTVNANETLTANFKKVNTYALDVKVEGGANDYMVAVTPAPTVVDGKNMYEEGTKVTLTASSNPILTFTNWSNGETAAGMAVTMTEDKAFTASYSAKDFIVAWDFYKRGNAGRAADFAAADNDAVSLVMYNEAGESKSWLDKSQEAAGGYEGRPAAVCWVTGNAEGDVGHHYWQTCVNASAFTDIKVITAMTYNYNAYSVQNVEYSLDGQEWTKLGSISIEGAKKWTDATFSLPADANNQQKVYIRWISDKTSTVSGAASANDGIALGATFITGTAKLIDDGKAPEKVSTVPADGASGASANGKIVITFDEKVKLTETAKATLSRTAEVEYSAVTRAGSDAGEMVLPIAVSGKTVTCEYKGLEYNTGYTFKLAAGSVADLTDNVINKDIVICFTTKVKPAVTKALYDFVVDVHGTLAEAFAAANAKGVNNTVRYRILIPAGEYVLPAGQNDKTNKIELPDGSEVEKTFKDPTTYVSASNISFIGTGYGETRITNSCPKETVIGKYGEANISEGIGSSDVIDNMGTLNYFQGITIKTSMGDARGRDIAFNDKGNKTIFKDACLWGYQDTYVSNNEGGKFYFEGGVIRGRTDYLCGKGDVFYNEVTLQQCGTGGYLAVPSIPKKYGYVFQNCYIKKETSDVTFHLGRPWGKGTPIACFINTKMDADAIGNGWADMSGNWPKRFAEYNSFLTSGTQIDLSGRRTSWKDGQGVVHNNDPILTIDDVQSMSLANVMGQNDDWDPTALTEQASAPTNVVLVSETKQLSWDDSNYVLGWVVFKNGKYAANLTTPSYTVDETNATWTVRAANEMGGLGEATTATVSTAIVDVNTEAPAADGPAYNTAGMRVNANAKGIIIRNGKKYVVK